MDAALSPSPQQPSLSVRLFGEFRLSAGGADVTPRGRKARGLIAFLAVAVGQSASRERLADLLWSDRGEDQARASMRQALAELRSGAPGVLGALEISRETVRLAPGSVATDAAGIVEAAREGDLAMLAARLDATKGMFLDDLQGLSPGFDDWLTGERVRQQERLVAGALGAAAAAQAQGDAASFHIILGALERLDPGSEQAARLGLRADHAAGDTAAMHRRYRRLTEQLQREFAIRPSEETRRLFETLKTSAPETAAAASKGFVPTPAAQPRSIHDAPPLLHVAPFVDGGDAPPHLATALRDEILSGLSRFRDLRLAASDDGGSAGDYTIVGSLRASNSGFAINPQLRHSGDGKLVWAERFDLPRDGLQAAIDRIVGRIVAAVLPAVTADVFATILPRPAAGLYSRYLLARQASRRPRDFETAGAAAAELEAIIAAEPTFAPPMLALARIYNTDFIYTRAGSSGAADRARAFDLARAALALDHDDVGAWTAVGWSHLWHGNWGAAAQHFDGALTLNPFNVTRLLEVVFGRIALGDLDGAAQLLERCLEIDPRPGDPFHGDRGLLRLVSGDHVAAAADFDMIANPDLFMLIYAAANAALTGQPSPELRAKAEAGFGTIHASGAMCGLNEFADWVDSAHPFRNDDHRRMLRGGVEMAFR